MNICVKVTFMYTYMVISLNEVTQILVRYTICDVFFALYINVITNVWT